MTDAGTEVPMRDNTDWLIKRNKVWRSKQACLFRGSSRLKVRKIKVLTTAALGSITICLTYGGFALHMTDLNLDYIGMLQESGIWWDIQWVFIGLTGKHPHSYAFCWLLRTATLQRHQSGIRRSAGRCPSGWRLLCWNSHREPQRHGCLLHPHTGRAHHYWEKGGEHVNVRPPFDHHSN